MLSFLKSVSSVYISAGNLKYPDKHSSETLLWLPDANVTVSLESIFKTAFTANKTLPEYCFQNPSDDLKIRS